MQSDCFPSNRYLSVFRSKKPLHLSQCGLKQYTAKQKMISKKKLSPIQSKELAEISIFRSFHFL